MALSEQCLRKHFKKISGTKKAAGKTCGFLVNVSLRKQKLAYAAFCFF